MYAEERIKTEIRQVTMREKAITPSLRLEMAKKLISDRRFSICIAFSYVDISESGYRCVPKISSENALIADWLLRLTQTNKQWFLLCAICIYGTSAYV